MIKTMKILLLFLIVLSIPVNSTLINIKKNIKNTQPPKKNSPKRILKQDNQIMEIIVVIIIIFLFFNSPVWALALFTIPVLFNAINYMYKFEAPKKERKLVENSTNQTDLNKFGVLNKDLENYLIKIRSNVYKYLSISNYKIKNQLDQRQLAEMVKDYLKNKNKLNDDTQILNKKKDERSLKEKKTKKSLDKKEKLNFDENKKEDDSLDLEKKIDIYSKFIFKGRIQFRQLIDEL